MGIEVKSLIFDPSTKRIKKIDLSGGKFGGRVFLDCLPDSLEWLDISSNYFEGPLDLSCLPPQLKYLFINQNKFTGELQLDKLPSTLKIFFAYQNHFSSSSSQSLSLLHLPANLEDFNINSNRDLKGELIGLDKLNTICPNLKGFNCGSCSFEGKLDLRGIPDGIERLSFHNNKFSGEVEWTLLLDKKHLTHLDLYDCELSGEINLGSLPRSLQRFYAQNNHFNSSFVDLSQMPPTLVHLDLSNNNLSGSLSLSNRLPSTLISLSLSCNEFTGFNLELSRNRLPMKLESLDISKNKFTSRNMLIVSQDLPPSLKTLVLHSNDFSGEISFKNNNKRNDEKENEEGEADDDVSWIGDHLTFFDARWCPNLKFVDEEDPDCIKQDEEGNQIVEIPHWVRY